jgi:hypothetical protein
MNIRSTKANGLEAQSLKKRFLQCMRLRTTSATALQGVVKRLIDLGISRKTLVAWAVQGGYSQGSASNFLSRIYSSLGFRERRAGAGRKPSPDTLELLAHARTRYGERAVKVLRAAWRTGKAQAKSDSGGFAPQSDIARKLPVAPPLRSLGANNGPIIRRNRRTNHGPIIKPGGNAAPRTRVSFHPFAANLFKGNGNRTKKSGNQIRRIRV